jgi:hypothetical protein
MPVTTLHPSLNERQVQEHFQATASIIDLVLRIAAVDGPVYRYHHTPNPRVGRTEQGLVLGGLPNFMTAPVFIYSPWGIHEVIPTSTKLKPKTIDALQAGLDRLGLNTRRYNDMGWLTAIAVGKIQLPPPTTIIRWRPSDLDLYAEALKEWNQFRGRQH